MSCGPVDGKFRLLDAFVGWDVDMGGTAAPLQLDGLDDPAGLRLAAKAAGAVDAAVWGWLWPPRLARGCSACDLYLLTPAPARLLVRSACVPNWQPRWPNGCVPDDLQAMQVVAAAGHLLALADARQVRVWSRGGAFERAAIDLPGVLALAFEGDDLLAVTAVALHRVGPSGELRAVHPLPPGLGRPLALAAGPWLLTEAGDGTLRLWHGNAFEPAWLPDLAAAGLPPTGLRALSDDAFCLADGCWSWYGRAVDPLPDTVPGPTLHTEGVLDTLPLDSGLPRCRWHRVTLDADVPTGTAVVVQVASTDNPLAPVDAADWTPAETVSGPLDFLVAQPPGRWLRVRIRLRGDGRRTPVLRRVRLDFPRSTSLDSLPPVFRDNPRAEDFSERFLSLFDADTAELDAAIDQFPAALDVATARDELLPWLAGFLDLAVDPAWGAARLRRLIAALPQLYRLRGTVAGLQLAVRLVFDVEVTVQELAFERAWGRLGETGQPGGARLGAVRLFGRARARFALGRSALSGAPIRSWGRPELDAASTGAYRFRVLVPPGPGLGALALQRLARLVEAQKPAHTQMSLRSGGAGFVLGVSAALGVDSLLGPLPAPVLGAAGNVRLRRSSVLWSARPAAARPRLVLGEPVLAGLHTVLE